jgi:hypothetical protein
MHKHVHTHTRPHGRNTDTSLHLATYALGGSRV